jgi:hypothetical protein
VLAVAVLAASAAAVVRRSGGEAAAASPTLRSYASSLGERVTTLRASRLEQAAVQWRGGPVTTSTGEVVTVLVSETFAPEITPENWAEFLVQLVHGSELQQLTTYVAPLAEVQEICGARALGCYGRNRAITLGETLEDGTTGEAVLRHEYGHHIALYRSNAPWAAIDWGPKHWASAAGVCAKVSRSEAYPGDEGENYALNPGEAWAEVYRLVAERRAGITTASWQIIAPSFYPSETMLQAAERDVLEPWTAGQTSVSRRAVARGRVWWVPVSTPLDGSYTVTVTVPRGGQHEVVLMAGNRRTVLKRATRTGPRTRRISGTICGQRSLFVRITQKGSTGQVSVTVAKP